MFPGSLTRFLFDRVGLPYHWLTDSPLWRDSIREMTRHFPPGGAELTVLVLGDNASASVPHLFHFRPDLHILSLNYFTNQHFSAQRSVIRAKYTDRIAWLEAYPIHLPIASNSVDAITVHDLSYRIASRTTFLREALRVLRPGGRLILLDPMGRLSWRLLVRNPRAALSILMRHVAIQNSAHTTLEDMSAVLPEAGFARVLAERAVDGYGVLSRGEKPYTHLSTVERIAQTAALDETNTNLQIVDAVGLISASRGKFVFLPVRQTPDKPAWAIQPGEALRWQAAMVNDANDQPYLLAFTSLSKAVEFMQSAVTSSYLKGINKVAKFDKAVAPRWSADMLLNPPFEALHSSEHYAVKGIMLDVDPNNAVTGEE